MDKLKELYFTLNEMIINPLIVLMVSVALLVFLFGMFEYIAGADDPGKRATGNQHMMWGFVGLLIMISAISILKIVANTMGVDLPDSVTVPK